jgi:putative endopeptidase
LDEPPEKAAVDAAVVMRIETDLAKGSLDRVSRRDPNQTYHTLTVHELFSMNPPIDARRPSRT